MRIRRLPRPLILIACSVFFLTVAACSALRRDAGRAVEPAVSAAAAEDLEAIRGKYRIGQMAAGVVDKSGVLFRFEGDSSAGGQSNQFNLASVSKIITAAAVMQLVDRGDLRLDDSVSKLLGRQLEARELDSADITVLDLLTHTSGLRTIGGEVRQVVPSGWQERYENANFALLAEIVSRVSDVPFAEYVDKNIMAPLGIDSAAWDIASSGASKLPPGAGNVRMTADDFGRFVHALMIPDKLLSEGGLNDFRHLTAPGIDPPRHLAWQSSHDRSGNLQCLYHAGTDIGAGCEVVLYPGRQMAYFILTDVRYSPQFFAETRTLLENLYHLPNSRESNFYPPTRQNLDGIYTSALGDSLIEIREKPRVTMQAGGAGFGLAPVGPLEWAAFDPSLDAELGASLARAEGTIMEVVVHDGKLQGIVWNNKFHRRSTD